MTNDSLTGPDTRIPVCNNTRQSSSQERKYCRRGQFMRRESIRLCSGDNEVYIQYGRNVLRVPTVVNEGTAPKQRRYRRNKHGSVPDMPTRDISVCDTEILALLRQNYEILERDGSETNKTKDTRTRRRVHNIQQKPAQKRVPRAVEVEDVIGIRTLSDHVGWDEWIKLLKG